MKKRAIAQVLICALFVFILALAGCSPTDPYPETMYTQDIYPAVDNTYSLGDSAHFWHHAYISELMVDSLNFTGTDYYVPDVLTITNGTYVAGTLASLTTMNDGDTYRIKDEAVMDGLIVTCTFDDVDKFTTLLSSVRYGGTDADGIQFELYNNTTLAWDGFNLIPAGNKLYDYFSPVIPNSGKYISVTRQVNVKIHHYELGVVTHEIYIDMLILKRN